MKITEKDFKEIPELAEILIRIDKIDSEYVNRTSDEIFQRQPFFLTVLLGYRFDVSPQELEEIMKIYFLIWEYFRPNKNVQTKIVTQEYFEKIQNRNIQMFKYVEGEPDKNDKLKVYSHDLHKLKSKSLLTAILFRFENRPVLSKMNEEKKGIILIGIKTFIESFETI